MDLQADLIAYYEAEAAGGLRTEHARAMRLELRSAFAEVLVDGGVRTVLDVGAGPGLGELRPYRFFSLASHDRWREILARHATVEEFCTFEATTDGGWEYQFAVVRAPG